MIPAGGIELELAPLELVPLFIPALMYSWRARHLGTRGRPVPAWRQACFGLGLGLIALSLAGLGPASDELLYAHMVEHLGNMSDPVLADAASKLAATGLSPEQVAAQLARMIDQQAYTRAANDIFLASAVLFIVLIAMVWMTKPLRKPAGDGDAGGLAAH